MGVSLSEGGGFGGFATIWMENGMMGRNRQTTINIQSHQVLLPLGVLVFWPLHWPTHLHTAIGGFH